ncbi:unnamed protein product [Ceutorhynchus assimilis]|uniref:Peptidase C1A papain C-terminal domain-containing protein n=1 Tax=Ceutorhynchus assimilis TaxID=467358 RepID=A0A9N9QQZ5_9CUCU|nr:unnamed protein product [Ceutorhynchus assimilis]
MKSLCVLFVAIGLASAFKIGLHPLSDEYIAEINSKQSTWRAGRNFEVDEYPYVKVLASGIKKPNGLLKQVKKIVHDENEDIPESFDAREAWPKCADVIGMIRDQSRCGSCWAFAAAESMSDRICIHSNGEKKTIVSAQDLLTCSSAGGCRGGNPSDAWEYWHEQGIVSGGLYNRTDQGCKSYFLPTCDDHPTQCTEYVGTPECVEQCDDASLTYKDQKTYGLENYEVSGEQQMQLEILKNGPVEATMDVFNDFLNYKSGVYQVTNSHYLGTHAVKMLGWGVENGVKYWLMANSWNERWGEAGYFKILRGHNEAGIELWVDAGLPDLGKF